MFLRAHSHRTGYELPIAGELVWARVLRRATSVCLLLTIGVVLFCAKAGQAQSLIGGSVNALNGVYPQAYGVVTDAAGDVYYVDNNSAALWEAVPPSGTTQFWSLTQLVGGFSGAQGIAIDASGNIFVADTGNNEVKEVPAAGGYSTVKVLAGGAVFNAPAALAVDGSGNVLVADTGNNAIKFIGASNGYASVAQVVTSVGLQQPAGIAIDASGNLYVSDASSNTILQLSAASSYSSATPLGSGWKAPKGLALDSSANLYVVDNGNSRIVEVLSAGGYTTQTLVTQETFYQPTGIGLDVYGDLFVAEPQANEIFEIAPQTTQFPATALLGTSVTRTAFFTGNVNGSDPTVGSVQSLTVGASSQSQFSIVNGSNNCGSLGYEASCSVRVMFTPTTPGVVRGAAVAYDQYGNVLGTAHLVGIGTAPQVTFPSNGSRLKIASGDFLDPEDIVFDGSGNLIVADGGHQVVERYNPDTSSLSTIGPFGLTLPYSVALDGAGNLFISDNGASLVYESLAPNYTQTVTLGSGFSGPKGIAVDGAGNLFVTDTGNHAVKELTAASGYQTTLTLGGGFSFPEPTDAAVDSKGNLYVVDRTAGTVYEMAANCGYCSAQSFVSGLDNPRGVTVDASDSLYVSNTDNGTIYEIANVGGAYPTKVALVGSLNSPVGLATDSNGNLWAAESGNNTNWISELPLAQPAALAFNTTPQYQTSSDSPRPVLLANRGNAPLIFSTPSSNSNPSISTSFTYSAPSGSGCPILSTSSAPVQLEAEGQCELDVSFTPQTVASISGQLTFNDNNLNQPGGSEGTQTITLTGTSVANPAIDSVSPSQGPIAGGATVTITGTNFSSVTSVSFGGHAAQSFTVKNSATIIAVTPLMPSGQTVDVIVSTSQLSSSATPNDQYTFVTSVATVTMSNWQTTYNGSPVTPLAATTSPVGLAVNYTWNGSSTMPTNVGTYTIVGTIDDYRYTGSGSATLTIYPGTASCFINWIGGTTFAYNGSPQMLPVSTTPAGLNTTVTYSVNGNSVSSPVAPGTYTEMCTVNDPNWSSPSTQDNFTITKATAYITITPTSIVYTGSPISPPISVIPSSEAANATVTYNGSSSPPVNPGTYTVTATINDTGYSGSSTAQVTIAKIPTTITIQPTNVVYNGSPQAANITVSPSTPIAVTYNGSSTVPTNAGTYNVAATASDAYHTGSATGTLTITQAAANLSITSFTVPYDGNAHPVTVTNPHNISYTVTYNGSLNPPVSAGSYNVSVEANDPNWSGSASGTVTITQIAAQLGVSNQSVFYDDEPQAITTVTASPSIPLQVTYNGSTTVPTQAGVYTVVVSATDTTDYNAPPATATFTIAPRQVPLQPVTPLGVTSATVTAAVYFTGQATLNSNRSTAIQVFTTGLPNLDFKEAGTGTCTPGTTYQAGSSCTVDFTFTPSAVGNRHGVVQLSDTSGTPITGAVTYISGIGKGSLVTFPSSSAATTLPTSGSIGPAVADAAGNLFYVNTSNQTLNENVAATGQIRQLASGVQAYPWSMAIDGAGNIFAGNISVVEEFVAANNYAMTTFGSSSLSSPAGLVLDSKGNVFATDFVYQNVQEFSPINGYSTSTVISSGYSEAFSLAMDGNDNLFVQDAAAGTIYELTAASNYQTQTSVVHQGFGWGIATDPAGNIYANTGNSVNIYTAADGYNTSQPVVAAPSGSGVADITADASGHLYVVNGSSIVRVDLTAAPALSGFTASANSVSSPQSAPVVNSGTDNLTFAPIAPNSAVFPLDSSTTCLASMPLASGSLCTIAEDFAPTVAGTASGELDLTDNDLTAVGSVQRILLSGTGSPGGPATVTLGSLISTYDGNPHPATVTTAPANLSVNVTYNGSTTAPVGAGSYAVVATVTSAGYTGSTTGTLVINRATATVVFTNLTNTYNGQAQGVAYTTTPANISVSFTYNGGSTPSNAGSYAVVATVTDPNTTGGTATATMTILPAAETISFSSLIYVYNGQQRYVGYSTTPDSAAATSIAVTYNGSPAAPANPGTYNVVATFPNGSNYTGSGTATMTIAPAAETISFSSLIYVYNGQQRYVGYSTTPDSAAAINILVTYNGSPTAPTNAGTYNIVATFLSGSGLTGSGTATMVISQAPTTVTWQPPQQNIHGGTSLAPLLNASGSVAGPISYQAALLPSGSPQTVTAASVLPAGQYQFTATLAPSDTNYAASTQSLVFTVQGMSVFVVNAGGSVSSLLTNGTSQTAAVSGGGHGAAVDGSGNVWSIDTAGASLTSFTDNGVVSLHASGGGLNDARALAADGGGVLWIANGNGTVSAFTTAGVPVSSTPIAASAGMGAPSSVSVDTAGSLWLADTANNAVVEVIGVAGPVTTPIVNGVINGIPATRP